MKCVRSTDRAEEKERAAGMPVVKMSPEPGMCLAFVTAVANPSDRPTARTAKIIMALVWHRPNSDASVTALRAGGGSNRYIQLEKLLRGEEDDRASDPSVDRTLLDRTGPGASDTTG